MAGPLKNARHERFAQELAKGKSQTAAYKASGYSATGNSAEVAAARLIRKVQVANRVAELKEKTAEKVVEKTAIDAAWVLSKAVELHDKALAEKAFPAAKGALELIGKHVEVRAFREHVEHSGLIEYRDLSDDEVEARIRAHEGDADGKRPTAH